MAHVRGFNTVPFPNLSSTYEPLPDGRLSAVLEASGAKAASGTWFVPLVAILVLVFHAVLLFIGRPVFDKGSLKMSTRSVKVPMLLNIISIVVLLIGITLASNGACYLSHGRIYEKKMAVIVLIVSMVSVSLPFMAGSEKLENVWARVGVSVLAGVALMVGAWGVYKM